MFHTGTEKTDFILVFVYIYSKMGLLSSVCVFLLIFYNFFCKTMFLVVGGGGRARDHDELNSNFGLKIMFSCYF